MTATEFELHRLELDHADLRVVEPRQVARLSADIADGGQRQPVLVVPRDNRFVLIDGYRRVAVLRRLGRDTVLALPLALSQRDALLLAYRTDCGRRRSAIEDGWLMRELIEQFGLKQAELAKMLSKSESFVSRRLALVFQLSESVQKAVRDGRICAYAAQRSLVPLARANRDHAERLMASFGPRRAKCRPCTRRGGQQTARRPSASWRTPRCSSTRRTPTTRWRGNETLLAGRSEHPGQSRRVPGRCSDST